jgi:hypothetical protein
MKLLSLFFLQLWKCNLILINIVDDNTTTIEQTDASQSASQWHNFDISRENKHFINTDKLWKQQNIYRL